MELWWGLHSSVNVFNATELAVHLGMVMVVSRKRTRKMTSKPVYIVAK